MEEFFDTMKRQFTDQEWDTIQEAPDTWQQLKQFYRYWVTVTIFSLSLKYMYICLNVHKRLTFMECKINVISMLRR